MKKLVSNLTDRGESLEKDLRGFPGSWSVISEEEEESLK